MASFIVQSPGTVPTGHTGPFSLTLVGTGTSWTNGTTFTVSGVSGVSKSMQIVNGPTAVTLVITTGSQTGTLTVSDGTLTATVPVKHLPAARRRWLPPRTRERGKQ